MVTPLATPMLRPSVGARDVEATRLLARVCARLPTGFWQRRMAARAFGLTATLPPVDREGPGGVTLTCVRCPLPLYLLVSPCAVWALSPGGQHRASEVLSVLDAVGPRSYQAAIGIIRHRDRAEYIPLVAGPRLTREAPDELKIGLLTWTDARAIFRDAAEVLAAPRAASADNWLHVLEGESRAEAP